MIVHVSDGQLVGEVQSVMFTVLQSGPVNMMVVIKNSGVNTMNYDFQDFEGTGWVDLGPFGSVFNNTLSPNQVVTLIVSSPYPQVQLLGNASGGAFLEFAVTRYANRASGGPIPILNL
jgi:hypothetical protein